MHKNYYCVCCHTYCSTFLQNKHTRMKYSSVNLVLCELPGAQQQAPHAIYIFDKYIFIRNSSLCECTFPWDDNSFLTSQLHSRDFRDLVGIMQSVQNFLAVQLPFALS